MENNKENQECVNAPEQKKKGGGLMKFIRNSLTAIGGVTVAYLVDEYAFGGKCRKYLVKEGKKFVGKATQPKPAPVIETTVFVTESPNRNNLGGGKVRYQQDYNRGEGKFHNHNHNKFNNAN